MDVREKLVELIGQVQDCGCDVTDVVEMNYVENIALADHLIANGVVISNSEKTSKWIPVTERLPEYETEVLTYRKSGISVETRWRTYWDYDEFSDSPVTHWMPLPQPPKGE